LPSIEHREQRERIVKHDYISAALFGDLERPIERNLLRRAAALLANESKLDES
jgi:hypothetical protein